MIVYTYTPGIKENRGIMGNTYTSHIKGVDMSYVDTLEPKTNFAIQGSTRVQMNMGKSSVSTILFTEKKYTCIEGRTISTWINT